MLLIDQNQNQMQIGRRSREMRMYENRQLQCEKKREEMGKKRVKVKVLGGESEKEWYFSSGFTIVDHPVSNLDTLPGIAIKYGVEVADIKRINGLMSDLQMFAHKSLQIPIPGKHLPSHGSGGSSSEQYLSNGPMDGSTSSLPPRANSAQRGVSPSMDSLQGYFGVFPVPVKGVADGTELSIYKMSSEQDAPRHERSNSDTLQSLQLNTRSSLICSLLENRIAEDSSVTGAGGSETLKLSVKSDWRPVKFDVDGSPPTPEMLLKDDSSSGFSAITGKSLALRPNRAAPSADTDSALMNPVPVRNTIMSEGLSVFRKSSSTSNLQEPENNSSLWPTSRWSKKSETPAVSATCTILPIFDGLPKPPKPMTIRKKAALD